MTKRPPGAGSIGRQCPTIYTAKNGRSHIYCQKRAGHAGDHRGHGRQWNSSGPVKITEPLPEAGQ